MAKKSVSFPTFRKWAKKLTHKQRLGLIIGAFALLILPLAVWAVQNQVRLQSDASALQSEITGAPIKRWWYDDTNKDNLVDACQPKMFDLNTRYMYPGLRVFSSENACLLSLLGPRPTSNPKRCLRNYQCQVGYECSPLKYVVECTNVTENIEKCFALKSMAIDGRESLGQCTAIPKPCLRKGQTCGRNNKITNTCCGASKCNVRDTNRPGKIFCN